MTKLGDDIPNYEDFEYEDTHNVHLADSTTGSVNQDGTYADYNHTK